MGMPLRLSFTAVALCILSPVTRVQGGTRPRRKVEKVGRPLQHESRASLTPSAVESDSIFMRARRVLSISRYVFILAMMLELPTSGVVAGAPSALDEPLIRAALRGEASGVETILNKGADINVRDSVGRTALMWAVWRDNFEIVRLLVQRGADVNARDSNGSTALMLASARDHQLRKKWYQSVWTVLRGLIYGGLGPSYPSGDEDPQIVKLLLEKGADVKARDRNGWTALMRARDRGAPEIVELLKRGGATE
jgi:hypothetical protein